LLKKKKTSQKLAVALVVVIHNAEAGNDYYLTKKASQNIWMLFLYLIQI
jgi:hypothetical protein